MLNVLKICIVVTAYIVAMCVFADFCYSAGVADGFKAGEAATIQSLSEKLNPVLEKCHDAMERLESVDYSL